MRSWLVKCLGLLSAGLALAALFFRGQAHKEKAGRLEERQQVKDKAYEVQQKSSQAHIDGLKKEAQTQTDPVNKDEDYF